jgi:DNA invertase Pin-like site-specific DNA recombinase
MWSVTRSPEPSELVAQVQQLRAAVREDKKTIQTTRDRLRQRAAALADLEAECSRRGITVVHQSGVGVIHGRSESETA